MLEADTASFLIISARHQQRLVTGGGGEAEGHAAGRADSRPRGQTRSELTRCSCSPVQVVFSRNDLNYWFDVSAAAEKRLDQSLRTGV